MFSFLRKVWSLARPYKVRMILGVLTGIVSGLLAPLMIVIVMFVYGAIFPTADANGENQLPMRHLPEFAQRWFFEVRNALENSLDKHPSAVIALILAIPAVVFLRGLFGYMNVYFL